MTMEISNFYLMTPLKRPEYIQMELANIPDKIIKEYNMKEKATPDGSIHIEANKGMYGLRNVSMLGDITNTYLSQVFGNTNGNQYNSH